jgi:predicted AlkP superfamily pyrophosphatase or phosphodiesterase
MMGGVLSAIRASKLILVACSLLIAQPARDRHVVILSIDGLPAYALHDRSVPLPALRRLAQNGAIADAMEVVNPSVTWPNHTSMVTGVTPARHGMLYNGLPVRGKPGEPVKVEPWRNKSELVLAPTLYDVAHAAGLTTAEVDWVAILNAPTITWTFPEVPRLTDPVVKEMIAAGNLTESDVTTFSKAPITYRDEIWTQAGEHIIRRHKPNLLLWHLLTTDSTQHRYGARSLGGNTALALADAKVQRIIDALKDAGILDRTTIFIVSDHGFKTYRQVIRPNAFLRERGIADVHVIPEGGTAMVYVTRPERKAELLRALRTHFSGLRGIAQVLGTEDFDRLGYPQPSKSERMADLVLAAADGYGFDGSAAGEAVSEVAAGSTPGSHGYLSTDADMDAALIISGAGVKSGIKLGRVRNLDIAPTAARLLGLNMKEVQGKVLTEILR